MGLRKRPYNEEKKGDKGGSSKRSFGAAPAKRSFKSAGSSPKEEGRFHKSKDDDNARPKRSGGFKSGDDRGSDRFAGKKTDRTPAKRTDGYKRSDDGRFASNKRSDDRGPAKRTGGFKRNDGDDFKRPSTRRPSSSDSGFERRTPAKRAGGFKRSDDDDFKRPARRPSSSDSGFERRTPAKRAGGFKRNDGDDFKRPSTRRTPSSDSGFERRTPAKRAGGFKRNDDDDFKRPSTRRTPSSDSGFDRRPPSKSRGFTSSRSRSDEDFGWDDKPRTSKSGKPYMVKGAKARDIKAKSEEKLDLLIPEEIRLNRYISNSGICSRREADDLIAAGLVSVNGKIITEMGLRVKPGDEVRYNNERLSWEKKVYLLMNKPKDSITTSDDPEGRKIIMDLIKDPRLPRVYPVGRLDRNTTGVILLTNDGELAQRLTHPKYNITKVYKATLSKSFAAKDMQELANNGVELEDGPIRPDIVGIPSASEKNVVMVQIHSGRNRIIHRMFEAMGYVVEKLDRIDFAGLERKGLERGEWRHLDDKEMKKLKKLVQLK